MRRKMSLKTFEEANEWERKHEIAAAVKRLRDRQP